MAEGAKVQTESLTSLLVEFGRGNRAVEPRIVEKVYSELRRVAAAQMRRERGDHTLQPTALVNEAWMRLTDDQDIAWQNRAHFFAVASRSMRQILVDHARRDRAGKRGGAYRQVTMTDNLIGEIENQVDILAVHQVLEELQKVDPRACQIVEFHFFGGLSFEEIAAVLNVSTRTVKRDWSMARAWLRSGLSKTP